MQAVLKDLYSTDIDNIRTYVPDEEDNFGFLLRTRIGPQDGDGEESFDITICTPKWRIENYRSTDVLLGPH